VEELEHTLAGEGVVEELEEHWFELVEHAVVAVRVVHDGPKSGLEDQQHPDDDMQAEQVDLDEHNEQSEFEQPLSSAETHEGDVPVDGILQQQLVLADWQVEHEVNAEHDEEAFVGEGVEVDVQVLGPDERQDELAGAETHNERPEVVVQQQSELADARHAEQDEKAAHPVGQLELGQMEAVAQLGLELAVPLFQQQPLPATLHSEHDVYTEHEDITLGVTAVVFEQEHVFPVQVDMPVQLTGGVDEQQKFNPVNVLNIKIFSRS